MRNTSILVLAAATLLAATPAFAKGPLESQLMAYQVQSIDGKEVLKSADGAVPGDLIEYRVKYENVGDVDLTGIVVRIPIPAETLFKMDSQSTVEKAMFEVSADDGENWGVPPLMQNVGGEHIEISVSEYDLVRWSPDMALEPGGAWGFAYRVSVK